MDKSKLEKNIEMLENSYEKVLDNMDGLRFKDESEDNVLLTLDLTELDYYHQAILNTVSGSFDDVKYRIKFLPSVYIEFIRTIGKMIVEINNTKIRQGKTAYDIVNKIIIFGDLTYGFKCGNETFKCKGISFESFLSLQDVMITFMEDYASSDSVKDLDELSKLRQFINNQLLEICNEEHERYKKNIFMRGYFNIRNFFRKDIISFSQIYLKVIRGEM